ncbi:MAG: PBP1A family penicillin-binding protein [Myxococcales bacterium]|nr:PBP1A family penicillin-binding protein [Myxococcales bacterium]
MSRGARPKPPPKGGKRPRKAPPKKGKAAPSLRRRLLRIGLLLSLALGTLGAAGLVGGYFYFVRDLPDIRSLRDYQPPQVSRMFAADGTVIGEFFTERRTVVGRDRIPDVMVHAILSAEDADFYRHEGLDFTGMLRALYNSLRAGRVTGSGSTITQQTVKNLVLSPEKRFERKAKELILARRLETHLSKDDILTIYLNAIYFGHGRYGVQEAARYFWGKDVSELTLPQAAMLAGVVQSPERLSPRKHPDRARERRAYVLDQMVKNGHVGKAEAEAAKQAPFDLAEVPKAAPLEMRWFVDAARDEVVELVGAEALTTGGLRVHTTLDPARQRAAVAAVQAGLKALDARQGFGRPEKKTVSEAAWRKARTAKLKGKPPPPGVPARARVEAVTEKGLEVDLGVGRARVRLRDAARFVDDAGKLPYAVGQIVTVQVRADGPAFPKRMDAILAGVPEAALVVLDPQTRDVLALVGGYDHRASPLNRAVQAHRQPGSAFKPFVWGAAFETKRFTPASRLVDAPETHHVGKGKFWTPKNYTGTFKGPITLRTALAKSVNSIAVSLIEDVGVSAVQDFARRATISSPLVDGPTLALGASEVTPLELVNAFATFAADGRVGQPRLVTKVVHADGAEEQLGGEDDALQQGLDPAVVWVLRDVMRSVVTEGSGAGLKGFPRPVVGKTGTSNEARDAWFVGLLPDVVAGAWVGFDRPRPLGRKEAGGRTALPIVKAYLEAMETKGPGWPAPPEGVEELRVDPDSERLAAEGSPGVREVFLAGTAPTEVAPAAGQVDAGSFFFEEAAGPALDVPTIGLAPVPETLSPLPPAGGDDDGPDDAPPVEDDEDRPL